MIPATLANLSGQAGTSLYCSDGCPDPFSAQRGDYFYREPDRPFLCMCGAPMYEGREVTRIDPVLTDLWTVDPDLRADWQQEVASGDTLRSFAEYREHRAEVARDEDARAARRGVDG